jgi:hypothetical protein
MANEIDNAIARIQDIAAALTTVPPTGTTITALADYPIEAAGKFPFVVSYLSGGNFNFTNASMMRNFPSIRVEFHFSRTNLQQAYQQIYAVALEFPKRLSGDPRLNNTIDTIVASADAPIPYEVRPFEWAQISSQMLAFTIPVKTLQAPTSTA